MSEAKPTTNDTMDQKEDVETVAAPASTETPATEGLQLRVVYAKETKKLTIGEDKTVADLKQVIEKETGCPVSRMKLMYKGLLAAPEKPELDEKKISDVGLKKNAKVLVVGATQSQVEQVTQADHVSTTAAFKAQASATRAAKNPCDEKPHKDIIAKGPPPDAPFAYRPGQDPVPAEPIVGILGSGGKKARLHVQTSSNKLTIHYPTGSQDLPFSSIIKVKSHPIPNHEQYHMLALRLGKRTVVYLYWVPAQYISAIKGAVLGYGG